MSRAYRKLDLDISCIVDILDCVLVPGWGLEQIISVQRNHKCEMRHGSGSKLQFHRNKITFLVFYSHITSIILF